MAVDLTKSTISFSEIEIPEQKLLNFNSTQIRFPTVLSPIACNRNRRSSGLPQLYWVHQIEQIKDIRGAPAIDWGRDASEFNDVVEAFGYEDFPYVVGARSRSTECNIPFHHELSHTPQSPSKLFFFCETEPKSGGETPIFPSNLLYQMMLEKYPDFIKKLEEQGLCYSHFMGSDDNNSSRRSFEPPRHILVSFTQ